VWNSRDGQPITGRPCSGHSAGRADPRAAILRVGVSLAARAIETMRVILALLIVVLIARNTLSSGFPFEVLRGVTLFFVALVAFGGALQAFSARMFRIYWPQFGYILAVLLSVMGTADPLYVAFHAISLATVILFSIACYESDSAANVNKTMFTATFWGYLAITAVSVLLVIVKPQLAYETLYRGELRFRGILPKAGMAGACAGVLLGLSLFVAGNPLLRTLAFFSGAICLVLTQSRTFWIAALGAASLTYVVYARRGRLLTFAMLGMLGVVGLAVYAMNVSIRTDAAKQFIRADSITNLTGRVQLWDKALSAVRQRPLLGFGVTAGANAFKDDEMQLYGSQESLDSSRDIGRTTMHSGYVQSLLDVGIIGTFFYLALIMRSVVSVYRFDQHRAFPAEFFLLVFLGIANLAENVIYGATVFNSVLFFMLAGFAAHLRQAAPAAARGLVPTHPVSGHA
jgi:O-antigen ligase